MVFSQFQAAHVPRFPPSPEVETLLSALGRSDNAMGAMKVLGPHAGKVKQAKEAAPRVEGSFGSFGACGACGRECLEKNQEIKPTTNRCFMRSFLEGRSWLTRPAVGQFGRQALRTVSSTRACGCRVAQGWLGREAFLSSLHNVPPDTDEGLRFD